MKNLITVLVGGASITVAIVTAVAQAHGAFIGKASLRPYLYAYGIAGALLLIAVVTAIKAGRQESTSKHKEITVRLAALMKQEREIRESLKSTSDDSKYTELVRKANDWVNETVALLNEAELPTDAEALHQVGTLVLSPEQLSDFAHVPHWKRDVIARLALYRQTLDQIRSNRRL